MVQKAVSRTNIARALVCGASALVLAGCGAAQASGSGSVPVVSTSGTGQPAPTPAPSPTSTPTPAPTPTATPASAPTATPTPIATTGLDGVVAEGDSISYFWGGNYTGRYASSHSTVQFHGTAVGGSGIDGLTQRLSGDLALKPAVMTVLIGANDLGGATSAEAWLDALWTYVAAIKATGAKVVVGTVLPLKFPGNPTFTATHNSRRATVNAAIRAAVGAKIDAVADFAADPLMGPDAAATDARLYGDGIHPTDGTGGSGDLDGQGRLAAVYAPVVDRVLGR